MALQIKLLGSFQVEDENGTSSAIMKGTMGCALLTYLLVTKQGKSRESLADLLWDAASTTQSLQNLRKLLSRTRKMLPNLKVTRTQVAYEGETADTIDLYILNNALAAENTAEIDTALRLYRGDLLQGFYLENGPRFNEWLLLEREQLRRRVMAAYRQVCVEYVRQEAWQSGVDTAERWLAVDNYDEEALRYLMQMSAASGQIDMALQHYDNGRRRLWEELGIEPERTTKTLAQQLRQLREAQGDLLPWHVIAGARLEWPHPETLAEPGPLPALSVVPYQRNLDFTGREPFLRHLAKLLLPWPDAEEGQSRTLAVTGMGGVGKTQLAVEFCYRYGRYFPGGVFWLSFADAQNVASEVAAVGGERGMELYREVDKLTQNDQVGRVLRAFQKSMPRLLIFDNCEEEALLAEWVPVTGGCRVLVTSRRASWSRELQVAEWPLPVFEPPESVTLLQQLAPELNPDEAEAIAEELGHLPLALHLAGGFLNRYRQVSGASYLAQLQNKSVITHPSLIGRGIRYSPTGHELNVYRTFAINLDKLDRADEIDETAWKLLARAACFAPGEPIPIDLLQTTVLADGRDESSDVMAVLTAEDGLARLISLGFLQTEGADIVVMHRLVAAFTLESLTGIEEAQMAVEQAVLQRLLAYRKGRSILGVLPFSVSHLQHVTDNAFGRSDGVTFRLGLLFGIHLRYLGDAERALDYFTRALTVAEQDGTINGQAEVMIQLGITQRDVENSLRYTEQAAELLQSYDSADKKILASALHYQGWSLYQMGQTEAALAAAEEALALLADADAPELKGAVLNLLGVLCYYSLGRYELGYHYQEQALAVEQELGNRFSECQIWNNMGENARLQGDYESAVRYYQAAIDIAQELESSSDQLFISGNLCGALVKLGQYGEAVSILEELIPNIYHNWRISSEASRFLAEARLGQGEIALALEAARGALEHGRTTTNVPYDIGRAWRVLGQIAARLGRPIRVSEDDLLYDAPACFARSLEIFTEIEVHRDRAITLWQWAEHELLRGNEDSGNAMWQEARDLFGRLNLPRFAANMEAGRNW